MSATPGLSTHSAAISTSSSAFTASSVSSALAAPGKDWPRLSMEDRELVKVGCDVPATPAYLHKPSQKATGIQEVWKRYNACMAAVSVYQTKVANQEWASPHLTDTHVRAYFFGRSNFFAIKNLFKLFLDHLHANTSPKFHQMKAYLDGPEGERADPKLWANTKVQTLDAPSRAEFASWIDGAVAGAEKERKEGEKREKKSHKKAAKGG